VDDGPIPEVAFDVAGWPPIKNDAKSMLAANHRQNERVRTLLQAARAAVMRTRWVPLDGPTGLDVVVRTPSGRRPGDATNVFGGIADVLQGNGAGRGGIDLSHLGPLGGVALYRDDRQLRQVHYREELAAEPSYSVRVWTLEQPASIEQDTGPPAMATSSNESASQRGRRVLEALATKGVELGFTVAREYPVQGGRLDLVWLLAVTSAIPGVDAPLPVVGFEVESSWRTRKHLKGDYLNLHDLGAALGVIVPLGEGDDIDATQRFAQAMVDRPGPRVLVWSEAEVQRLVTGKPDGGAGSATVAECGGRVPVGADKPAHAGKYRGLWAWLRDQPGERLPAAFAEIEEIIGMPLPSSCRRHPAHWSSYEGSAVARAIQDAGWVATSVDLEHQQLVLTRRRPSKR
jgi:hypothetical protein